MSGLWKKQDKSKSYPKIAISKVPLFRGPTQYSCICSIFRLMNLQLLYNVFSNPATVLTVAIHNPQAALHIYQNYQTNLYRSGIFSLIDT